MQQLKQSGSEQIGVQIDGDRNTVTIYCGTATLTLDQRHGDHEPPETDLDLLDPKRCPVALVGRTPDLESLQAWLFSSKSVAVQCRTGRAGSGKTRLALELCRLAEAKGWVAGFLPHRELERFEAQGHVRAWAWPKPTLVVIDYAATSARPLRHWLEDLAAGKARDQPIRLLLLERHASGGLGWWGDLTHFAGFSTRIDRLLDPPEPLELTRVSTATDRRRLLEAIMVEAAKLKGISAPQLPLAGTDDIFDAAITRDTIELEPLFLLMAGLTAVQRGVPHVLRMTRIDLAEALADRELFRLSGLAKGLGIDADLLQHLTACIGLMNGCPSDQDQLAKLVTEEATCLGYTLLTGPGPFAKLLADTFTSDRPDRLDPIRPDLIGEAAILETFKRQQRTADWQAATVTRAYDRAGAETTATIIRTTQDFATSSLDHWSLLWLDCLIGHVPFLEQLMDISNQLPQRTINLRERAAIISRRLADILCDASLHEPSRRPQLAIALNNLGFRLSELGQRKEALQATEKAVAIYCELAKARPDAFMPDLADALNDLGSRLSAFGLHKDALKATKKAVVIYRKLGSTSPDAFKFGLANALNNLGNDCSALARRESAVLATDEAVAISRKLAALSPDVFKPLLAGGLNNLHNRLRERGRYEDAPLATNAIEKAVTIFRELAASWPDAFKPDLAMALNNFGGRQEPGRQEDALRATEEAVAIYMELTKTRPDSFELNLALSLATRADCLEALGRHNEALISNAEAIQVLRPTFLAEPMAVVHWMGRMCVKYLERSQQRGLEPDVALLAPINDVFKALQAQSPSSGEQN